jgi:hypothetical protein
MQKEIKFTALFVKDIEDLLKRFPPKHKKIFGHHSTIEFQPNSLDGIEVGKELCQNKKALLHAGLFSERLAFLGRSEIVNEKIK